MKLRLTGKWPLLGLALTATVIAALTDPIAPAEGQKSSAGDMHKDTRSMRQKSLPRTGQAAGRQMLHVELERLSMAKAEQNPDVTNAFGAVSWYEPPPPPAPAPPQKPIAPSAPPLPFTYFGRYENPPNKIVMLARNEQIYTVSEGDVIDEIYRVDHITDGSVTLVYLPLGTVQTVSMNHSMGAK